MLLVNLAQYSLSEVIQIYVYLRQLKKCTDLYRMAVHQGYIHITDLHVKNMVNQAGIRAKFCKTTQEKIGQNPNLFIWFGSHKIRRQKDFGKKSKAPDCNGRESSGCKEALVCLLCISQNYFASAKLVLWHSYATFTGKMINSAIYTKH